MKVIFTVLAVCLIQVAMARVARETPPATANDAWEDVVQASRDTLSSLHTAILNLTGVRSDEELINKVTTQAQSVGTTLQSKVAELTKETQRNAGKFENVYKQFTDRLTEVVNDLKNKNKDLFGGDSKKLQENIERDLNALVENSKALKTRLNAEGEAISVPLNELFSSIVQLANTGAKDVTNAIKESTSN